MVVVGERWCHIVVYPSPIVVYLHWTYQLTFFIVDKYITQWCRLSMVVVGGERWCLIVPCVGGDRGFGDVMSYCAVCRWWWWEGEGFHVQVGMTCVLKLSDHGRTRRTIKCMFYFF
jgi:hypothetical protein